MPLALMLSKPPDRDGVVGNQGEFSLHVTSKRTGKGDSEDKKAKMGFYNSVSLQIFRGRMHDIN
jgi:hypothetical protein